MQFNRRVVGAGLLGLAATTVGCPAVGGMVAGAASPRLVRVLAATDRHVVQPMIDDFERSHPGLRVDYVESGSLALYDQVVGQREDAPGRPDVLWSSAMDLQIKLVNDGYAQRYQSPHADQLPKWAVWKHEAYGITHEPVGIAVNRRLLAGTEVPRTRAALAALLLSDMPRWRGRVATYDIARAGLGFLIAAQEAMATPRSWDVARVLGRCEASLHEDTQSMLERVAAGDALLAYNVLGSYAEAFARKRPDIAVSYFDDYTLVVSRVAFISRTAPNLAGARLWLDYMLSAPGQQLLAASGGLYGVRTDAAQPGSEPRLGRALRPIALGPGLLAHLDRSRREAFLKRWNQALRPS
jgi:iron(III) transport system substrate-binding protein